MITKNKMLRITTLLSLATIAFITSCNKPAENESLEKLMAQRDSLVSVQESVRAELTSLNEKIVEMGGSGASRASAVVSTLPVSNGNFAHYVEVSGEVASRKNVTLSAEHMGVVTQLNVQEGSVVNAGQVLLRQDAVNVQNQINETKTSLDLAKAVYERQKSLWDKKIGTEVQFLEAKNRVESLESRLATLQSQLAKSVVKAPFHGTVDKLHVRLGEMLSTGAPILRLVNDKGLYIESEVSEAYIGKFDKGDSVEVRIPAYDISTKSMIKAVGEVINPENRTFTVEVEMPEIDRKVKPNLLTVLTIKDYEAPEAITIPTKVVQKDNIGTYVYVVEAGDKGDQAKKKHIEIGKSYGGQTEVLSGLTGTETIVDEGYRDVTDGLAVQIAKVE